jgi:hypothetical protein
MPELFIANTTKRHHDFDYRIPENPKLIRQSIRAGEQVRIGGDLRSEDIQAIIDQHIQYGLISANDVKRSADFVGLCYSIGKPVPAANVMTAFEQNDGVLTKRGEEIRKAAAIAFDASVAASIPGVGPETTTEIVEDVKRSDPNYDQKVNEVIEVSRSVKRGRK